MRKSNMQKLVLLIVMASVIAALVYFSGCTAAKQGTKTVDTAREKAIQDSLQKIYIYELNKAWSTGYEYYKPKIYRRAIKPFWRIVKLDTIDRFKDVYALLSDCYFQLGIADSAQLLLEMGIEKYPDNVGLIRNLAWIYTQKERIDDAVPLYEKLVSLDGKNKDDFKNVANLYLRQDLREDAIGAYQKVLEIDPNDQDAISALSTLMVDPAKRIEMLLKNLENDPENAEVMFELAELYYREAEYTNAIKYFKLLLTKRPDDYIAMETLGACYYSLNDFRSSNATYKKIIAAKPNEKKLYTDVAKNYKELGELKTARTWARKALAKDRKYGLAYIIIGEIYEAAVDKCMEGSSPKFNDKLVYREAYRQYQRAAKDFEFQDRAERKMGYLKDFLPTKEDEFFNKNNKTSNGKYKVTNECYKWIAVTL